MSLLARPRVSLIPHSPITLKLFQVSGALVTVLGFTPLVMDGSLLGLIPINMADNILHVAISASALLVYFISGPRTQPATA